MKVCTPPQVQWKPPLRQAAGTLGDTRGRQCENDRKEERLIEQYIKTTSVNIKKKKFMVLKRKSKNDYENKVVRVMETKTISKNGIKMNNVTNKFFELVI